MIEAEALAKRYGDTVALAGIDLTVPAGCVLCLLGPNGAGKTTAVRIFTTLALPDSGTARVAGYDVVSAAAAVRRHIGVAAQDHTLDEQLTGRQNLVMIGELSRLSRANAKARAVELLEAFDLADAADRAMDEYSGGMRRRLDVAAAVVTRPPVLFLDEPTTGLDPSGRLAVWDMIRRLADEGVTLLLTTQYLDEADQLADAIAVVDRGKVIARGTPSALKSATGRARLAVTLSAPAAGAVEALRGLVDGPVQVSPDGRRVTAAVANGAGLATAVVRALDVAGILVDDVEVHPPSLDDVFFALIGHAPDDEPSGEAAGG
jgi:ABC-2 type transport system ATP-binding protein